MADRQLILWSDVPERDRRPARDDAFQGCPYAVCLASWEERYRGGPGYRRCGNGLYRSNPSCWSHLPVDPRTGDEQLIGRARGILRWSLNRSDGEPLAAFRTMTDKQISDLRNVGVKIKAKILEIRDTWTDEQIAELTGIPLQDLCPEPAIPPPPCVMPHGSLPWLGG